MKYGRVISLLIWMLVIFSGCTKKAESPEKIIAGEGARVWKEVKETNSQGEKDKVTKEEKQEALQFYSNHTFTVSSPAQSMQGKWNYNEQDKNLSLQFGGESFTQNFTVLELKDSEIKLKAADGSLMVLKPERD